MNKILKTALLSTIILTACGNKEEPIEEPIIEDVAKESLVKPEIIDEDTGNKEVERSSLTPMSKDFERLQDSYFYKETTGYRLNVPETHIEDASDIAGLYTANQPSEEAEGAYPLTVLLDVNEDGTFTRYSYYNMSVADGVTKTLKKHKNKYINNENNLETNDSTSPIFDKVHIVSGYVVEAYGEKQLHAFEELELTANYNETGEVEFLDILNETNEESFDSHVDIKKEDGILLDDFGHSIREEIYTPTEVGEINHSVFLNDGSLKSAHHIQTEINIQARDRINAMKEGIEKNTDFPEDHIYFLNNNEFLQYLNESRGELKEIITEVENFTGYTLDNREMNPTIVFLVNEKHVALFEHGEVMIFDDETKAWEGNYYKK